MQRKINKETINKFRTDKKLRTLTIRDWWHVVIHRIHVKLIKIEGKDTKSLLVTQPKH